jgi:hypothetical protein
MKGFFNCGGGYPGKAINKVLRVLEPEEMV